MSLLPVVGREEGLECAGAMGEGGSCIVRVGSFLGLRPMAEARVLNLRVGRPSLDLDEEGDGVEGYFSSSSAARLETERFGRKTSLEDFERDHHGLDGFGEGRAGGMRGMEGERSVDCASSW